MNDAVLMLDIESKNLVYVLCIHKLRGNLETYLEILVFANKTNVVYFKEKTLLYVSFFKWNQYKETFAVILSDRKICLYLLK